jgi:hypothetical protein
LPAASQLALTGWDALEGQEGDLIKRVLMTGLLIAWLQMSLFLMRGLLTSWLLMKRKPIGTGLVGWTL